VTAVQAVERVDDRGAIRAAQESVACLTHDQAPLSLQMPRIEVFTAEAE
jgi:hypothetical protein